MCRESVVCDCAQMQVARSTRRARLFLFPSSLLVPLPRTPLDRPDGASLQGASLHAFAVRSGIEGDFAGLSLVGTTLASHRVSLS